MAIIDAINRITGMNSGGSIEDTLANFINGGGTSVGRVVYGTIYHPEDSWLTAETKMDTTLTEIEELINSGVPLTFVVEEYIIPDGGTEDDATLEKVYSSTRYDLYHVHSDESGQIDIRIMLSEILGVSLNGEFKDTYTEDAWTALQEGGNLEV